MMLLIAKIFLADATIFGEHEPIYHVIHRDASIFHVCISTEEPLLLHSRELICAPMEAYPEALINLATGDATHSQPAILRELGWTLKFSFRWPPSCEMVREPIGIMSHTVSIP